MNPDIFKAYDIRGKYLKEISVKDAFLIGQAFNLFLQKPQSKIALAFDTRPFSAILAQGFKAGFESKSGKIKIFGILSTPAFYYLTLKNNFAAGVIFTASHLGKNYAGLKFTEKNGKNIGLDSGLLTIKKIVSQLKAEPQSETDFSYWINKVRQAHKVKKLIDKEGIIDWLLFNLKLAGAKRIKKPLRIVIDLGNGPLALYQNELKKFLAKIGLRKVYFCGNKHLGQPKNPLKPKFQKEIKRLVLKEKLDLGFAFDADADRILVFDKNANLVQPDFVAGALLAENKFKKIVITPATSLSFKNLAKSFGQRIFSSKVGHTFVKEKMHKVKADFAFEISGHFYLKQKINDKTFYFEAPVFILLKIIDLFSKNKNLFGLKKQELIKSIDFKYKKGSLKKIARHFRNKALEFNKIDGYYFRLKDFWFSIRKSNTENLLRLRLGSQNKKALNQAAGIIKKLIR